MRTYHKVAGAILALQIVLWAVTGFLFNYKYRYDEALEQFRAAPVAIDATPAWVSPAEAFAQAGVEPSAVRRVELIRDNRGYVYLFETGSERQPEIHLADARTGAPIAPLDASGADAAFRSALSHSTNAARYGAVRSSRQVSTPSLLLGHDAAAWELDLASGQKVTVNAYTAEIAHTAMLNDAIDWTYRVHYMQYTPWKPVNIGIVIAFLILLLSLVASGVRMLVGTRQRTMFGPRGGSRRSRIRF